MVDYCPRPSALGNSPSWSSSSPRGNTFDYLPNTHEITVYYGKGYHNINFAFDLNFLHFIERGTSVYSAFYFIDADFDRLLL